MILRILLITVRADIGGGPEHVFRLLKGFYGEIEAFIAAPNDKPYFLKYKEIVGEKRIIEIPHRKFLLKDFLKIKKFIIENDITILHSHGKGAGIYSRILSLLTYTKAVHTFHGIHIKDNPSIFDRFYLFIEKILSNLTEKFITVSVSEKETVLKFKITSESKIELIHNGVVIPENEQDISEKFSNGSFIHVSRFDYAKNSELMIPLIKTFQQNLILQKRKVLFIGDGDNREYIEKELNLFGFSNQISFLGFQNDLSEFYRNAFLLISTSRWEGLPLSVLEAMSFGTPILATDVRGNKDLVSTSTGYLFNPDNLQTAVDYVLKIQSDFEYYKYQSLNSKETCKREFGLNKMIAKTLSLYQNI